MTKKWAATALVVLCVLVQSLSEAAASRTSGTLPTGPTLEQMRQSAVDFEQARAAGDALGMARAALARKPFDAVAVSAADLGSGFEFLSSRSMLAQARAAAGSNESELESIADIERSLAKTDLLVDGVGLATCPRASSADPTCRDPSPRSLESIPVASIDQPAGRVLTIAAGADVLLRADVGSKRTLFVYVESKAGAGVRLSIVDAASATQVCVDSQAHGYLLCRWQPGKFARGVVRVSNGGATQTTVLLIAHQT